MDLIILVAWVIAVPCAITKTYLHIKKMMEREGIDEQGNGEHSGADDVDKRPR